MGKPVSSKSSWVYKEMPIEISEPTNDVSLIRRNGSDVIIENPPILLGVFGICRSQPPDLGSFFSGLSSYHPSIKITRS